MFRQLAVRKPTALQRLLPGATDQEIQAASIKGVLSSPNRIFLWLPAHSTRGRLVEIDVQQENPTLVTEFHDFPSDTLVHDRDGATLALCSLPGAESRFNAECTICAAYLPRGTSARRSELEWQQFKKPVTGAVLGSTKSGKAIITSTTGTLGYVWDIASGNTIYLEDSHIGLNRFYVVPFASEDDLCGVSRLFGTIELYAPIAGMSLPTVLKLADAPKMAACIPLHGEICREADFLIASGEISQAGTKEFVVVGTEISPLGRHVRKTVQSPYWFSPSVELDETERLAPDMPTKDALRVVPEDFTRLEISAPNVRLTGNKFVGAVNAQTRSFACQTDESQDVVFGSYADGSWRTMTNYNAGKLTDIRYSRCGSLVAAVGNGHIIIWNRE